MGVLERPRNARVGGRVRFSGMRIDSINYCPSNTLTPFALKCRCAVQKLLIHDSRVATQLYKHGLASAQKIVEKRYGFATVSIYEQKISCGITGLHAQPAIFASLITIRTANRNVIMRRKIFIGKTKASAAHSMRSQPRQCCSDGQDPKLQHDARNCASSKVKINIKTTRGESDTCFLNTELQTYFSFIARYSNIRYDTSTRQMNKYLNNIRSMLCYSLYLLLR